MLAVLIAHALAAVAAPAYIRAFGRNGFLPLALVPAVSLGWVVAHWGRTEEVRIEWVPGLSMNLVLRFDDLAAIMCLLVLGVGALVLVYCARYFTSDEPRLGLFAAEMVAFAGSMFGLVTADDMLLLYVFWEATTVLSSRSSATVPNAGRAGAPRCRHCWSPPRAGWRCWSASSFWARSPAATYSPT